MNNENQKYSRRFRSNDSESDNLRTSSHINQFTQQPNLQNNLNINNRMDIDTDLEVSNRNKDYKMHTFVNDYYKNYENYNNYENDLNVKENTQNDLESSKSIIQTSNKKKEIEAYNNTHKTNHVNYLKIEDFENMYYKQNEKIEALERRLNISEEINKYYTEIINKLSELKLKNSNGIDRDAFDNNNIRIENLMNDKFKIIESKFNTRINNIKNEIDIDSVIDNKLNIINNNFKKDITHLKSEINIDKINNKLNDIDSEIYIIKEFNISGIMSEIKKISGEISEIKKNQQNLDQFSKTIFNNVDKLSTENEKIKDNFRFNKELNENIERLKIEIEKIKIDIENIKNKPTIGQLLPKNNKSSTSIIQKIDSSTKNNVLTILPKNIPNENKITFDNIERSKKLTLFYDVEMQNIVQKFEELFKDHQVHAVDLKKNIISEDEFKSGDTVLYLTNNQDGRNLKNEHFAEELISKVGEGKPIALIFLQLYNLTDFQISIPNLKILRLVVDFRGNFKDPKEVENFANELLFEHMEQLEKLRQIEKDKKDKKKKRYW